MPSPAGAPRTARAFRPSRRSATRPPASCGIAARSSAEAARRRQTASLAAEGNASGPEQDVRERRRRARPASATIRPAGASASATSGTRKSAPIEARTAFGHSRVGEPGPSARCAGPERCAGPRPASPRCRGRDAVAAAGRAPGAGGAPVESTAARFGRPRRCSGAGWASVAARRERVGRDVGGLRPGGREGGPQLLVVERTRRAARAPAGRRRRAPRAAGPRPPGRTALRRSARAARAGGAPASAARCGG